ncbi:poly(A)-binding protein binding protein [Umbelopsis sp. WA50703]
MAFNNVKQQGKKQDMPFQKYNTSRGGGKKWANAGASNNRANPHQGSGSNNTSGHSSPVSATPSSPSITDGRAGSATSSEGDSGTLHMHDRMLFLLASLVGSNVRAKTKDGAEFEGLFHAATTTSELSVVLKLARKLDKSTQQAADADKTNPNPPIGSIIIPAKDLVEIYAANVKFDVATRQVVEKDSFKTDVDISGRGAEIRERELHRWNPESHSSDDIAGLEDADTFGESNAVSWDQFAANEKLFGLTTNFHEEIYTTKLDRSAPDFKAREKRAAEVAAEIQKTAATNVHIMEERGLQVDDSGLDEEDRYGAVVRDANPNKYMPPALRKQMQQKQGTKDEAKSGAEKARSNSPLKKLSTNDLPKAVATAPSPVSNLGNLRPETAALLGKVPVGNKKGDDSSNRKPIETEIANTFRQFAIAEKDKLNAKKQALQKKEKDGRLADLMKFHQTFKLNVPVPPDLVPLLSKTKKSPDGSEGSPKEDNQPEQTPKPAVSESPAATVESAKPATTSSPAKDAAKPAAKPASTFKFNIKASEFKPNPSAPAFVPGGAIKPAAETPKKQHQQATPLTLTEAFVPPSAKGKQVKPDSVGPTWPYGSKSYRHQFHQFSGYDDDVFQNNAPQSYPYNYPYRYAQYVPGMAPVPVQQPGMPYMNPQFVAANMPYTSGAMPPSGTPSFSPQMTNAPTHGQPYPQGFNSPQRSPMVPQGMPPHQVYQYQGQHRGGPMMMRYPPDMVSPNISPAPVMMPPGQPHSTPPVMSGPMPPRPSGMDGGGRSPYTSPQNVTPSLSPQPSNPESSPRT